jgi:hypothetical protein
MVACVPLALLLVVNTLVGTLELNSIQEWGVLPAVEKYMLVRDVLPLTLPAKTAAVVNSKAPALKINLLCFIKSFF